MMPNDLSNPDKNSLIKTGKLTAIGGGAIAVIVMQAVAFGLIMDIVTSFMLVGIGYGARMWTERK